MMVLVIQHPDLCYIIIIIMQAFNFTPCIIEGVSEKGDKSCFSTSEKTGIKVWTYVVACICFGAIKLL